MLAQRIFASALLLVCAGLAAMAWPYQAAFSYEPVGPRAFPLLMLALMGLDIFHFWGSLILLGVGWNFGFIGATALLTECYRPSERAKVQALNDFLVFGTVAVASFGSGQLLHSAGWNGINIGMLPLVAVVLVMLGLQARRSKAAVLSK